MNFLPNLQGAALGAICFFNTTPFWGGGEKWHLEAALHLASRGHRVVVLGSPGSPLISRARTRGLAAVEFSVSNRSWLNPFNHRRLVAFFRDHGVETVVFNGPADLKAGGLAARLAGVHRRVYRRGLALPVGGHLLNRCLFRQVMTHVVANSEKTRETLFRNLPGMVPEERIAVIYNGIDLAAFDQASLSPAAPARQGGIVIGTVGRLTHQKNHALLLGVARLLADAGRDFRLLIAGDGELAGKLQEEAVRLELGDRVEFLGFVENVPAFMRRIDIFVLPSSWEGFGYVLVEAGAAGRPTVAFRVSSNPEIVEDGTTGFLVEPGDPVAFARRIHTLADDPALCSRMGQAARRRVSRRFTQAHAMDELERFLELGAGKAD